MRTIPKARTVERHEVDDSGETILHDNEQGQLVVLNPIGAAVFELIDGERDLDAITDALCLVFHGVSRDDIARDVRAFVDDLAARALVDIYEVP